MAKKKLPPKVVIKSKTIRAKGVVYSEQIREFNKLELCVHALDRMVQRKISKEDVIQALKTPTRRGLATDPPKKHVAWLKKAGWELHVIYVEKAKESKLLVVTVYVR